jgi:site-specific recombinase XerD
MEGEKKGRIKNKWYRQFLDEGIIRTLSEDDIIKALDNVKGNYSAEGKALLTTLYYTGARPIEVLDLKAKDIIKKNSYVLIKLRGAKKGKPRTIYLRYSLPLAKELYKYATTVYNEMFLFFHYRSSYKREVTSNKGETKVVYETTAKLRYWFKKWFSNVLDDGISPYFLRHNRFSKMMEAGLSIEEIKQMKGSRTTSSVEPYLHLSSRTAKKIARKNE